MINKKDIKDIKKIINNITKSVEKVFHGKKDVINKVLIALLCRGHVLLEDVPGVGKTILAKAIAISLGGEFKRIQCTPDLMPADVLGFSIYNPKDGSFRFREGPIVSNIILIDEINRATPRTQSALLEAMAENQITIEDKMIKLPEPYFILATENPIEFEGTFNLPESQKDRFFLSVKIGYPSKDMEEYILETHRRVTHPIADLTPVTDPDAICNIQNKITDIHVNDKLRGYIIDIVNETRVNDFFQLGVSPRGSLALYKGAQANAVINGRDYVAPEDIKDLVIPIFSKRVILKPEYQIKGITVEEALNKTMENIDMPVVKDIL